MLTNAFYYKLYRPYIVSNKDRNDIVRKKARITNTSPQDKLDRGMMIVLNKSLKNEIINYARNVSNGVTSFKSSVHMSLNDMGSFSLNVMYNGYESAISSLEDNLTNLTTSYNRSTTFLQRQQQSPDLRSFSQELRDRIFQGKDRLELLGFSFYEESEGNSYLNFDSGILRSLNHIEIHAAIGANIQLFHSLHQRTTAVLTAPLSHHMPFRGLSYHYNYQMGRMVEDGLNIIESGMIVDRVV